jgi:hypothetical protein
MAFSSLRPRAIRVSPNIADHAAKTHELAR